MAPDFSNKASVESYVNTYRRAIADLESQTTDEGRKEWEVISKRLRKSWADWQGADSLHEMAFGEPK